MCVCIYIYIYIYNNQILLSHKKEWNPICSNMYGPKDNYTKWSNPEKTNIIWYHLFLESNTNEHCINININELIYKTEIYSQS